MLNQYKIGMYYSTPRINEQQQQSRAQLDAFRQDWICSKVWVILYFRKELMLFFRRKKMFISEVLFFKSVKLCTIHKIKIHVCSLVLLVVLN